MAEELVSVTSRDQETALRENSDIFSLLTLYMPRYSQDSRF